MGLDAFEGGVHTYLVTGAYCREFLSVGSNDVDDASSSDPADEGAPGLLVDLTPGSFGDGGQLSMQIVHTRPFRFPIPRDPSDGAAVEPAPLLWSSGVWSRGASEDALNPRSLAALSSVAGWVGSCGPASGRTEGFAYWSASSRKAAGGAKNRHPVRGVEKSRMRS